VSLII
jgi:hypothetical protein